ncbi:MAG TPA: ribonuclease D [Caulobacterales bacterium]|nr:ribonuclease D [Caulobacterales bacterium]
MPVITDTERLAAVCGAMATKPFVAIDTEFMRETTYWPNLCLLQAAAPGVEAVIDPLAEGLDLAPLIALMNDPKVTKVFHAARQDLEIFYHMTGKVPSPLFDTQIAAMAAGHGDSIAYDALVFAMLKKRIDKSSRFTDWSRRPLSEDQLAYALADVTYLREIYPALTEELKQQGRLAWVADEIESLRDPALYDPDPEIAWKRLKVRKTQRDYLIALQVATAWRERTAQSRNVPRGRVLKDDALYEIAEQRPRTPAAFDRLRAVPKGFGGSRHGAELAGLLDRALSDPKAKAPDYERAPAPPPGAGPTVELLKVLLRHEAESNNVAPRLIASVADLEAIAASDKANVPALQGWRRDVFGERALALKHGRIALTLKDGKVSIAET